MNNHYYDAIINILTPFLGRNMTETSVQLQCNKLGISADTITRNNLSDLNQRLLPAIKVFMGEEKAKQITDSILHIK
jgi:hypothetical protein